LARVPDQAALEAALAGLPLVVVAVRSMGELADSEWAQARALLSEPAPGLRVPRAPWRSDRAPIGSRAGLVHRGENNREVMKSWLDMDDETCAQAEAQGALAASDAEPPSLNVEPRRAFRER